MNCHRSLHLPNQNVLWSLWYGRVSFLSAGSFLKPAEWKWGGRSLFPGDLPSFFSAGGSSLKSAEWRGRRSCKSHFKGTFPLSGFCKSCHSRLKSKQFSNSFHNNPAVKLKWIEAISAIPLISSPPLLLTQWAPQISKHYIGGCRRIVDSKGHEPQFVKHELPVLVNLGLWAVVLIHSPGLYATVILLSS